jgi:hypothetical protein
MTAPARRTVRSGGGCGGARSICSRRRDRGTPRPARLAPRRQPGSAFGQSLRACVLVARSCTHLRSVRPSGRLRPRYAAGSAVQRSKFVVRDLSRHAAAPILVRSGCSISRQTSLRTIVCRQPSDFRQPVINPQLFMMHFLYKIRVTLSSKKCLCFGPEVLGGRNERTYMCFARTDANDSEATFAGSKSRKCGGLPPHRGVLSFGLQ